MSWLQVVRRHRVAETPGLGELGDRYDSARGDEGIGNDRPNREKDFALGHGIENLTTNWGLPTAMSRANGSKVV